MNRPVMAADELRYRRTSEVPSDRKRRVRERAGGACQHCGKRARLEIDHVVAVCLGGDHEDSNLQALCHECHQTKTKSDMREFARRMRLARARFIVAGMEEMAS